MIGPPLIGLRGAVTHLAFGADGNLVTTSAVGAAIWDLKGTALSRTTQIAPLPAGNVVLPAVAFRSDGREVATFDGQLSFFDAATLERRGAADPDRIEPVRSSSATVVPRARVQRPSGQGFAAAGTRSSDCRCEDPEPFPAPHSASPSGDRPRS